MSFTFKYKKEYTVDPGDAFVDNGACIQFMPKNDDKIPRKRSGLATYRQTVYVKALEWRRIKPLLTVVPYKEHYGYHSFGSKKADQDPILYVLK